MTAASTPQDFWLDNLREADAFTRWTFSRLEPWLGKNIVELGCGIGTFTQLMASHDRSVLAADLQRHYVEIARRRLDGNANVRVLCADATALDLSTEQSLDTVVMLDVLEHIADDKAMLQRISSMLAPGGRLVLKVPAHMALFGKMDQAIGHHRRYNRRSIELLLRQSGFVPQHIEYFNVVGTLGWWLNGRLLGRDTPPAEQVALFSVMVPVLRLFDGLFRRVAGLSLIAVATPTPDEARRA